MDISLYYQEKGTGEALILLHGNGEDSGYFEHQIRFFSETYRVIAVDTRGHGKSPRGTAPFTLDQFATDLNEFMETLQIPKAIILGFSDGANIALLFALKHPEKIKALILNGANLEPEGMKKNSLTTIRKKYYAVKRVAARSEDGKHRLSDAKAAHAKHKMELLGLMVHEPHIKPDELSALQIPALVIAGTKDMIRQTHTTLIAKSIPDAALAIIPGDHFIAAKEAVRFNREVEQFLNSPQVTERSRLT